MSAGIRLPSHEGSGLKYFADNPIKIKIMSPLA